MSDASNNPLCVRVLIPDGGELEEPEEEGEASQEEEGDEVEEEEGEEGGEESEEESEEDEDDEAEEGEGEEEESAEEDEEDERSEKIAEEGTRILHLNLDGLFLDLLGLEVDLDEVTLNLTAVPGEGKLLGNLLGAVTGLLDDGGLSDLLGFGGDGEGSMLSGLMPSLPDLNPMERARKLASTLAEKIRELIGNAIDALPLEDLLSQFLEELVNQLVNGGNSGNGDGEEASGA